MADISILGYLQQSKIVNNGNNIIAIVDEYMPEYTHTITGEKSEARMVRWYILFKAYYIKFIKNNFKNGVLVKIKGITYPNKNGINVYGETIHMEKKPQNLYEDEKRVEKSMNGIDTYNIPNMEDF